VLTLLTRRARAQWALLAALLGVVAVGATLLGTCALLVTRTAGQALEAAAGRAAPAEVEVTAYAVGVGARDARSVAADTRGVLTSALAPFPVTTAARMSTVTRPLALPHAEAYLSAVEGLPSRARLVGGRWPRAGATPAEAVLLESTARRLGLTVGGRVHLGAEQARESAPAVDVTVVGIARTVAGGGWDRDPLGGAGYASGTYGPFLVDAADLLAGGYTVDRMEVTAHPDLSAARRRDLDTVETAVLAADRRLAEVLGDRVRVERVGSPLPGTLQADRRQQHVTAATVLAVAVLGGVLTAIALALSGRLTAGVRAGETALLSALGLSRPQLAAVAAAEAGALAVLAALIAVPASALLHAALTHLPALSAAGLAAPPAVTGFQVLAVLLGALALVAVLAWPGGGGRLVRTGADLVLVALAAVGWWQLHARTDGTRADAVVVAAPALLLAAGVALALRLVPSALRLADRLARRGRGLVWALAAFEAARRPQAAAAGMLIGLACATGTFGVAYDAGWQQSQREQAALAVGTDLALTLDAPPVAGQGGAVQAATGGVVSPAVDRGVAVGQWLGTAGSPPRLVAVDTRKLPEDSPLAPAVPAAGVAVPAGAVLSLRGTATGPAPLAVTPRLVVQDETGLRTACAVAAVPLDGRAHPLPGCFPAPGLRLVAVSLPVGTPQGAASRVAVTLTLPAGGPAWTATSAGPAPGLIGGPAVTLTGNELTMTATVEPKGPPGAARDLVATAFPAPPPSVPVAVSARFAAAVGARPGTRLSLTVGTTAVPVTVASIVPEVPSAPGEAAVLADLDALSRALIVRGDPGLTADAWWVSHPTRPGAAALHLGAVTTPAALVGGPVRAGLPAALRLLVPAAALLLLAGVILHVTFDLRVRAVEIARLRGLGMTRRQIRAVLLAQHAGVMLPLLTAGAAVGAVATWTVVPLLIRSGTGAAPVPPPVPVWPWPAEAALLALLLTACAAAVTTVVTVQTRRADAAHLRMAS
jgi:hypothetical protein